MAGGLNSIHTTQCSCTAAMLNRGVHIDEVVERVLVATRAAAGEYGERWNWQREERKIRGMCRSWLRKHPRLKALQDAEMRRRLLVLVERRSADFSQSSRPPGRESSRPSACKKLNRSYTSR
jgi:hypothetical protein